MNPDSAQPSQNPPFDQPTNQTPVEQNPGQGYVNPPQSQQQKEQGKDLHMWVAPARPFKRRNREFYVTIISIAAVTGLVLFLVDGFLPVMLIIALVFLFYVLSTVEPENIQYTVTTLGIKIADRLTPWDAMRRFWFTRRFDSELLVVETYTLPGRLELVINPQEKQKLEQELKAYLVHEEAPATFLDRSSNWFAKKLPQG